MATRRGHDRCILVERSGPTPGRVAMTAIDLDDYVAWLHAGGTADEHLPLYREGAAAVVRQLSGSGEPLTDAHVEAAVETEAVAGASARRLANLRAIGARLLAYAAERTGGAPAADDGQALELAEVPRGESRQARLARLSQSGAVDGDGLPVRGTMIDDLQPGDLGGPAAVPAAMPPRSALDPTATPVGARPSSPALKVPFTDGPRPGVIASPTRPIPVPLEQRPLPGCACKTRHEVYPDDYLAMWGKVYAFVAGSVGVFMALFWSRPASLAVSLGLAGLGALMTAASAGWRCTDCRQWIARRGLDGEQLRNQRLRSIIFLTAGVALTIGCVVMVQRVRHQLAEERRAMEVLQHLEEYDETGD